MELIDFLFTYDVFFGYTYFEFVLALSVFLLLLWLLIIVLEFLQAFLK